MTVTLNFCFSYVSTMSSQHSIARRPIFADVLVHLSQHGPSYKTSIARKLGVSPASIQTALKTLYAQGWIEQVVPGNPEDARTNLPGSPGVWYGITDKGRKAAKLTMDYRDAIKRLSLSASVAITFTVGLISAIIGS